MKKQNNRKRKKDGSPLSTIFFVCWLLAFLFFIGYLTTEPWKHEWTIQRNSAGQYTYTDGYGLRGIHKFNSYCEAYEAMTKEKNSGDWEIIK